MNSLAKVVLLKQTPEAENLCLIRNPIEDQFDFAKRRMVGTSLSASSMAGSLRLYYCCIRRIRSIAANRSGVRQPLLLTFG